MEDARPHSVCGSDFAQGETGNLEAAVYKAFGVRVQTCELFEDGKWVLVVEVPSRPVGKKLNVFDLMVLYSVRFGGRLPDGYNRGSLERLVDEGLVRKVADGYVLGEGYTPCDKKDVVSPVVSKLTDRQQNIFSMIVDDPLATIEKMSQALGVNRRTVDRDIDALKKLGYIRKLDRDNGSPWVVLK